MDSLFHFVFAFIAGLAVNARLDHEPVWVALAALSAVFIDVDHFFFGSVHHFHNVFVTVLFPALLFYAAYRYERGTGRIRFQSLVLLLFVMLNGHLVADLFNEGAKPLLFPITAAEFGIPIDLWISVVRDNWYIVTPDSIALMFYGGVIGAAYYAEEFIYFFEKRHESLEKALRDAART